MGKLTADRRTAFEIADLLDQIADAMRERNKKAYAAGSCTADEYQDALARQAELRTVASIIVAQDLSAVIRAAAAAQADVQEAIAEAKERLQQVRTLKKSIELFATVLALAVAVSEGNVPGTVAAAKALRNATKVSK